MASFVANMGLEKFYKIIQKLENVYNYNLKVGFKGGEMYINIFNYIYY